ncbi:MAG: hypothetical protein ACKN89_02125 [Cyanobium sp.]
MNQEVIDKLPGGFAELELPVFDHTSRTMLMAEGAMGGFDTPLQGLLEHPDSLVGSMAILKPEERDGLIESWCGHESSCLLRRPLQEEMSHCSVMAATYS